MTTFTVKFGDVTEESSDLLLLKFAQGFYGADKSVASQLIARGVCHWTDIQPKPWDFKIVETRGVIAPKIVMFSGTPPLRGFGYDEIMIFARNAVDKIVELGLSVRTMTTTVHGSGYGLDSGESLQRLIMGFEQSLSRHQSNYIERITFLTLGKSAERMLSNILKSIMTDRSNQLRGTEGVNLIQELNKPNETYKSVPQTPDNILMKSMTSLQGQGNEKKRVFVAMPFAEEFQNVYEYGIYPAVRNCNMICERVDETHFTGDVLNRIRGGIETSNLVIADLTEGRPNVYLEVGYAWGRGIPVIFVAKKGEKLHFDVSTHRCIFYGSYNKFAEQLENLIKGIDSAIKK